MSHSSLVPTQDPEFVYKLISPASSFHPSDAVLPLSALDKADGFYHLSTSAQVPGTANRFFPKSKFEDLLILKIQFSEIAPQVKWEAAKGEHPTDASRIFPHVYGDLEQRHVVGVILMDWDQEKQQWDFSQGWEDRLQHPIHPSGIKTHLSSQISSPAFTKMNNIVNIINNLIPRVSTPHGLRQYQLTLFGFIVIFGFLHLSLFMDGMASHLFFIVEITSALLYWFLPANYSLRPASTLKRQFYILIGLATTWVLQPYLLPLDAFSSKLTSSPSLFEPREVLIQHASKALNQKQIEEILKQGGKVEEGFKEQNAYAAQLAVALQALGWGSVLIATLMLVEAGFVWMHCSKIERVERASTAATEKKEAQAATASAASAAAASAASGAGTEKKAAM
ncbi:hypothetical protein EDD11_002804 [Mortierella claussenii]|nr:hypothetical protein EDD11_002804 [Mortierella claussenii]